jgi:hypothetical protein
VVVTAQLSKKRSRGKKKNHPGEKYLAERSALIEILSEIEKYSTLPCTYSLPYGTEECKTQNYVHKTSFSLLLIQSRE